jgi:uncharacterized membrane protein
MPFNGAAKTWFRWLAIALLGLAIGFRFNYLGSKVYWHDEVFTSLRVAGYLGQQVSDQVFTGEIFSAAELLQFQQLPPDASLAKTWASLVNHPEHPPTYYLLAYGWGWLFGASVAGYRGIAALFGILALPLVFILGRRLFPGRLAVAWLGLMLFAVSPVQLIYSQEAREYSFWVAGMLVATLALVRAVRHPSRSTWLGYSVGLALSLYGSLLTVLLGLSHLVFVGLTQKPRQWLDFVLASGGALVLFSPWLWVLGQNWYRFQSVTAWTQETSPLGILAKLWGLHYSATLVDFSLPLNHSFTVLVPPLVILGLLGISLVLIRSNANPETTLVLCMLWVPPLVIIGNDLLRGGQISGTTRYFLPSLMVVPVTIAAAFDQGWRQTLPQRRWRLAGGLVLVMLLGIASCGRYLQAPTWWNKGASYHNPAIARTLNQATPLPLLVVFSGDTALGNAISLSYGLRPETPIRLFPQDELTAGRVPWEELGAWPGAVFLYQPSATVREHLPAGAQWVSIPMFPGDESDQLVEVRL